MSTRVHILKIVVSSKDHRLINQLQHEFIDRVMNVPAEMFTLKVIRRTVEREDEPLG